VTGPVLAFYWGDDLYGLGRAAEVIGERVAAGGEPLERWRVTGDGTSADRIAERVATAPLFGGGTLVVLSDPAPLLRSKAERDAVTALLGAVAPGNALVFLDPIDGSGRRSAAVDALREAVRSAGGDTREFKAPKEGQLAAWIEQRARERSIRLGRGAAQVLAERVGGFVREGDIDRRRQGQLAVGELEKLSLYRPGGEIGPDDVRELVPEAIPGSTWALLDAIAYRRVRPATELLERLLGSTPLPVLIVVIHRRLRELLEVADRLESGEAPASLVRSMKLKPFRAEKLVEQARHWTLPELTAALDALLALDVTVKGADGTSATEGQRRLAFLLWTAELVAPER